MTLCNMAVEMGAKNGIIEPDETTRKFLEGRIKTLPDFEALKSDKDAVYERTVEFDVSKMEPQVACPSSVDNVKPVSEVGNVPIEQAFIGSCTNGRIEDLRLAAQDSEGQKSQRRRTSTSNSSFPRSLSAKPYKKAYWKSSPTQAQSCAVPHVDHA